MAAQLALDLLGLPRVALGEEITLPTRKAFALLAYLALAGATPRGRLAALLWSEQPEDEARRNLRQELYRLQSNPAGAWIAVSGDELALHSGAEVDVTHFDAAAAKGDFAQAATLYRGPLLQGFEVKGAGAFMDWLATQREALARTWRAALAEHAKQLETAGDLDGALRLIRLLLDEDPLQETHHREAMRLLSLLGDRGAALAQYEHLRSLLQTELALDPLPATAALARRIQLAQEQSLHVTSQAEPPDLRAPLIGRDEAWMLLGKAAGKLALIEGEAGVGKSRLAEEFGSADGKLLRIKGHEISRDTPFYPIAEALLQAWRADTTWFERLDPVWQEEVARLLPTMAGGEERSELPAAEARGRFLEGLTVALLTAANGGSVLFDDLQWFDGASAELLVHVTRRAHRVRLLATARTNEVGEHTAVRAALNALTRENLLVRVPLAPLTAVEVLTLVRALSGSPGAHVFSRRLHAATAGNPLFILESLRDLFSAGVLWREEGTWATPYDEDTEDYRELPISPSVREAVLRRIDRLGESVRRLLEAASLAGDGFALDWIGACTALSELELVDAADRAVHANVLIESVGGYRFAHDLIRRSLDDALTAERRKLLHRRLAGAMDSHGAPTADVARHLEAGGRRSEAIRHRIRAAEAAARIYALPEALAQYDAALADGANGAEAFRIESARIEVFRNLGDETGRQSALAAMAQLATEGDDPSMQVELAVKQTVDHFEHDRYEVALQTAQSALHQLRGRIDSVSEAALLLELGATLKALGRVDEAEANLTEALQRYREASPMKYANCAYWLCQCAIERGDLARAQELCDLSLAATERAGYRRGHALSLSTSAEIAFRQGDLSGAIDRIEAASREAREIGSLPLQRAFLETLIERLKQDGRTGDVERCSQDLAALLPR